MRWIAVVIASIAVLFIILGLVGFRFPKGRAAVAHEEIPSVGAFQLTPDTALIGKRTMDASEYTGSYSADYQNFSGTEYLFECSSIKAATSILYIQLMTESGEGKVFLQSGSNSSAILLSASGEYIEVLNLHEGDNCLCITAKGLTGNLEIRVEQLS